MQITKRRSRQQLVMQDSCLKLKMALLLYRLGPRKDHHFELWDAMLVIESEILF
jgi:hypothetical protein